jgi:bifunctional non-homologous end joining protein LigD
VQKHLASHLHYDFRLEHHGVLLSWAVPKGPSPDPATKRLAMQVEDHPVDYGSFEGVIPSGYGAGVVSLWDRGMWEPLVDDVDAALVAGKLPFVLLGERLKGAWTLVRTGRAGPRSWLLMKQRDHWAHSGKEVEDPTVEEFATVLAREPANPWPGAAPVRGGETGALFRAVMERATVIAGEAWTGKAATGRRRQSAQR